MHQLDFLLQIQHNLFQRSSTKAPSKRQDADPEPYLPRLFLNPWATSAEF